MASMVESLIRRGVIIPCPNSVQVGDEIDPERIAAGVILHAGTRLSGANTLISEGSSIGFEAPATIADCWIGRRVDLRGGYFAKSVFLDDVGFNSGAHVREGTIMEEQSFAGHTVALKQTILFPFVTLGSLINFCDCFMAGGTSRKNHSEVGSAYIHFNFTPHQDKATPSLIGDVPAGVMLRERPIFLGGQGGMVGPCVLSYGTVVAAGSIVRKDETRPNRLIQEGGARSVNVEFTPGLHLSLKRIVLNNSRYIANLLALRQWYRHIRSLFVGDRFSKELYVGLCATLDIAIGERVKRLGEYARNMPHVKEQSGLQTLRQNELSRNADVLPGIVASLQRDPPGACKPPDSLIQSIRLAMDRHGDSYIDTIQGLDPESAETGKTWLQGLVDSGMRQIVGGFCPSLMEP